MERRYYSQKYASLAISSALHGLIIVLMLLTWRHASTDLVVPLRHNPAEVQFYLPPSNPAPSSTSSQSVPKAAQQVASAPTPLEPSEQSNEKAETVASPSFLEPFSTRVSDSGESASQGSFRQAVNAAIKAEREGSYANNGSESSQIPYHVKERINQWGQISYKQRIAEALLQADKRLKRSIISHQIVRTKVQLVLTIKKNGMLDRVDYKKLSGTPDIDRYIKDLISTITFAPIPDRFSISSFDFPVTIDVTLLEGTNRIRLYLV